MKVAINGCFGGFGLSDEAFIEFMRRKGKTVYAEPGVRGSTFWETPIEDQPAILRQKWYEVPDEQREEYDAAREAAGEISPYDYYLSDDGQRADPDLIAVIEQFGDKAGHRFGAPRVVDIPDDVEWTIEEYDGNEWVAEKHRTWS
jgi:hypothetical protein